MSNIALYHGIEIEIPTREEFIQSLQEKFAGMPDTEVTRVALTGAINEYNNILMENRWYPEDGIIRGSMNDIWLYGRLKRLYITKENIDGEELFILSGETLIGGGILDVQEEFSTLKGVIDWITGEERFNEVTVLLRYRVAEATEEELKSQTAYSCFWELSECEEYYELKLFPKS